MKSGPAFPSFLLPFLFWIVLRNSTSITMCKARVVNFGILVTCWSKCVANDYQSSLEYSCRLCLACNIAKGPAYYFLIIPSSAKHHGCRRSLFVLACFEQLLYNVFNQVNAEVKRNGSPVSCQFCNRLPLRNRCSKLCAGYYQCL